MSFNDGENVGPYRIIEQLGQGGMATVYKAYHAALDRYVAIKALAPRVWRGPKFFVALSTGSTARGKTGTSQHCSGL